MARYPISWWEYTGRYSGPDQHGISSPILRNLSTGEEISSRDLPIAACWDCNQPADGKETGYTYPVGADGRAIACRLPGNHTWYIDGRASNCDMKQDTAHRCWVRHGTVGESLHVDKQGNTCHAGAGSIAVTGFHGFLHSGELYDC